MKSTQPADVDPDEFGALNHEFYGADPAEVINARLWMFVAFLADESASVQVPFDDTALERNCHRRPTAPNSPSWRAC